MIGSANHYLCRKIYVLDIFFIRKNLCMYVVDSLHACSSSDEHVQSARDYHHWVVNGKHEIVSQGKFFVLLFVF